MGNPSVGPLIEQATAQQVKCVLGLAMSDVAQWAFLSGALADRAALAGELAKLAARSQQDSQDWFATVCDDGASLTKLHEIKRFAKGWVRRSRDEKQRSAATLLYHATVAAALVLHGQNISERSPNLRIPLYEDLADILIADPLGRLFQTAVDRIAEDGSCGKR